MPKPLRLHSQFLWLIVIGGHFVFAILAFLLLPHGFDVAYPKFWTNDVFPIVLATCCTIALITTYRRRPGSATVLLLALAAMHALIGITAYLLFPQTGPRVALIAVVASTVTILAVSNRKRTKVQVIAASVIGGFVGTGIIFAQRAPLSSTHPAGQLATTQPIVQPNTDIYSFSLNSTARLVPRIGSINLSRGRHVIQMDPLLTFTSRSPDGFWTCFATRFDREEPARRLIDFIASSSSVDLFYQDIITTSLHVQATDDSSIHIEADGTLVKPIYSHLNTFTLIQIAGHRKLSISFSPCPDDRIDFCAQDFAPARFAYLDGRETFHVARAARKEKGPFTDLAKGKLTRTDPIALTFFDEGKPFAALTLHDFARQASVAPSPTAGWHIPQNAIEFSLSDESPTSPASIFISLAATSVGRGFESVTHAPGTYINRMDQRFLDR